jgi:hypothetical protein
VWGTLANSGVEPFDRACPELVEGLRAGSLDGFADVKDWLKPRLQQSKRMDPQFWTMPLRANFCLEEIHSNRGQVKDGATTLIDTDHVARRPLRMTLLKNVVLWDRPPL